MDFILSPIAIYMAVGTSVIVFISLFLRISVDFQRGQRYHTMVLGEMRQAIVTLREQAQPAASRVPEPEKIAMEPSPRTGSAINLTSRAQILCLHSRGTEPAEIARQLGLAQGEVRLTVKMHKLLIQQSAEHRNTEIPSSRCDMYREGSNAQAS